MIAHDDTETLHEALRRHGIGSLPIHDYGRRALVMGRTGARLGRACASVGWDLVRLLDTDPGLSVGSALAAVGCLR